MKRIYWIDKITGKKGKPSQLQMNHIADERVKVLNKEQPERDWWAE
jgi:hypothetical protein